MKGFVTNIEEATEDNENFRKVLYTARNLQLVVMSIPPGEDIGTEMHDLDQFIRIEDGEGKAVLDGVEHMLGEGSAVTIPSGTKHNIINTSKHESLDLYTVYAPPNHKDGTVHETKADAEKDGEHFDGVTSE
ncbi:cupin domain-containing protein [Candidatus Kaiserbacteria bacterium]|nr:cupin domain-containing protein [Candidatus Kaiserbacteria bacterium]